MPFYHIAFYSNPFYSIVSYSNSFYSIVSYSNSLYSIASYSIPFYSIASYFIPFYSTASYSIQLHPILCRLIPLHPILIHLVYLTLHTWQMIHKIMRPRFHVWDHGNDRNHCVSFPFEIINKTQITFLVFIKHVFRNSDSCFHNVVLKFYVH